MAQIDWNMVAACANVVIATTAVVAAWYALRQYRYALRVQDVTQVLSMYQAFRDVSREREESPLDEQTMSEVVDLLEVHERLLAHNLLSKHAINFYRDAISIHHTLSDVPEPQLSLLRKILRNDQTGYRHLIHTLKSNTKTKYITDW